MIEVHRQEIKNAGITKKLRLILQGESYFFWQSKCNTTNSSDLLQLCVAVALKNYPEKFFEKNIKFMIDKRRQG